MSRAVKVNSMRASERIIARDREGRAGTAILSAPLLWGSGTAYAPSAGPLDADGLRPPVEWPANVPERQHGVPTLALSGTRVRAPSPKPVSLTQHGSPMHPGNERVRPREPDAPSVPLGLAVKRLNQTSASLAWERPGDGIAGYRLYESERLHAAYLRWVLRADGLEEPRANLADLAPGSVHRYAVTAVDDRGRESERSVPLEVRALRAPKVYRKVAPGRRGVSAVVGESFSYQVHALSVPPPSFSLVHGPVGMTVDPDSGLVRWSPSPDAVGTATVTVRATNSEGVDDGSVTLRIYRAGTDLTPPSSVRLVATRDITSTGCRLLWEPAADNVAVAGYRVLAQEYGTRHSSLRLAGDTGGPETAYRVTSLKPGTQYRIWVAAYDAAGNLASISGIPPLFVMTLDADATHEQGKGESGQAEEG